MRHQTTKVRAAVVGLGWPGMQHLKGYTADPRSSMSIADPNIAKG